MGKYGKYPEPTLMPQPRRFNAREFFGYTGSPLALPAENVPMSERTRQRFEKAGQSAFVPYINPLQTLAGAQDYKRAEIDLAVGDAEAQFIDELTTRPSALGSFLQRQPLGAFS